MTTVIVLAVTPCQVAPPLLPPYHLRMHGACSITPCTQNVPGPKPVRAVLPPDVAPGAVELGTAPPPATADPPALAAPAGAVEPGTTADPPGPIAAVPPPAAPVAVPPVAVVPVAPIG